jgi:hypothetical protein
MRALFAVGLSVVGLVAAADARAQESQPKVSVVAEGAIPVKAESGEDGANLSLVVVNQGPGSVHVGDAQFAASSWTPPGAKSPLVRQAGVEVETVFPRTLPAGAARLNVRLKNLAQLTGDPVDGQLILFADNNGAVLGAAPVSITPAPQPSADWPVVFFWVGAGLFVVFSVVALVTVARARAANVSLGDALAASAPGPDWTAEGWSGKLAAIGGLLAIVLGAVTLPSVPREISKDTLVQMNVIFVVLLAVGPFIFYALRRRTPPASWGGKVGLPDLEKKGVWGHKAWILLSYAITAVAVSGQIGALTLLGCEITDGTFWHAIVIASGAVLALLTWRSFLVITYAQANVDWDEIAQAQPAPGDVPLQVRHQPITVAVVKMPPGS